MTEASKIGSTADRYKVMIIVGVNIGILILAGLIGMMCYNKRTYQEIYHKVPGITRVWDKNEYLMISTYFPNMPEYLHPWCIY